VSEAFVGQIALYGFNFAPRNWATCSGQILPISQNTQLFSLIGTYYGGNGTSNFALPDLSGNVAVSQGTAPGGTTYDMGETGGTTMVTLTSTTDAAHTHSVQATLVEGGTNAPAGAFPARSLKGSPLTGTVANIYNTSGTAPDTKLSTKAVTTFPPGGTSFGLPHNNMQPYLALNYCFCLYGIFPSRN